MAIPNVPGQLTLNQNLQFNGTDHEFVRANFDQTVRASGTASATVTSADITNYNFSGAVFFLDITSVPASGSATVSLSIQGKDPTSGKYTTLFTSAQVSAGTTAVMLHPGISASANGMSLILPRTFRVQSNVSAGATSKDVVFSVGMSFIV